MEPSRVRPRLSSLTSRIDISLSLSLLPTTTVPAAEAVAVLSLSHPFLWLLSCNDSVHSLHWKISVGHDRLCVEFVCCLFSVSSALLAHRLSMNLHSQTLARQPTRTLICQ